MIAAMDDNMGSRIVRVVREGNDREGYARPETLETVGAIFERMKVAGVRTLHVHRSALARLGLPDELPVPKPGEGRPAHPFMAGAGNHSALTPSVEHDGMEITFGAYQDGAGDPFEDCADARELLAAHLLFRDAFIDAKHARGWEFRNSAILTGWRLMHDPWKRGARKAKLGDALQVPEELRLDGLDGVPQVEIPYGGKWAASGGAGYPLRENVLAWDVNGQRLAACSRLNLGVGEPERFRWTGTPAFDPKVPGYHYVEAIEHPFEGQIPAIFEPGWHTTPRVAMAKYLKLDVTIGQSVIWPQSVAYLDPFYQRMKAARDILLAARAALQGAHGPNVGHMDNASAVALRVLKQTYLQPFGRLRSKRLEGHPEYRPSWYDHIIGAELAREYLRLHQLAQSNVPVLAVYFDTIIIESDSADPIAGAPGAIEVSSQLGKYKPVGVLPREPAHAALYAGEHPDVGGLVKAIKRGAAPSASVSPPPCPTDHARSTYHRPVHGGYPTPAERITQ